MQTKTSSLLIQITVAFLFLIFIPGIFIWGTKFKILALLPILLFVLAIYSGEKSSSRFRVQSATKFIYFLYVVLLIHIIIIGEIHYYTFFLGDHDVVMFTEIILETARGNFFRAHHLGDPDTANYLSHHFSPILLMFIPVMKIIPTRMAYVYFLSILTGISLVTWERICRHSIRDSYLYFLISVLPFFNPFAYNLLTSYHFEIIVLPLFLVFYLGEIKNNYFLMLPSFLLLLLSKEDVSFYFSLYSLSFLFSKKYFKFFFFFSISSLYFLYVPKFFHQYMDHSASMNWLEAWSNYGKNYIQISKSILLDLFSEWTLLKTLSIKIFVLLIPFSFLPIFGYKVFLFAIPLILLQSSSSRIWYNSFYHYYSYPVLPFLFISALLGLKQLNKFYPFQVNKTIYYLFLFPVFINLYLHNYLYHYQTIDPERVRNVTSTSALIPPGSQVSAQFDLGMFVSRDNQVYPLQFKYLKEYILVDMNGRSPYLSMTEIQDTLKKLEEFKKLQIISDKNGVKLYKKVD